MSRQFSPLPKQKTTDNNNSNHISSASPRLSFSSFKMSHLLTVALLFMRNITGGASQRLGHGYHQHGDYGMLGHPQYHHSHNHLLGAQSAHATDTTQHSYTTLLNLCENYQDYEQSEVRRLLQHWKRPQNRHSAPLHNPENPLDIAKRTHNTALARLVLRTTQDQYCQRSHSLSAYHPAHGRSSNQDHSGIHRHEQFEIAAEMIKHGCPVEVSPTEPPQINNINLLDAIQYASMYPFEAYSIVKHLLSAFSIHHPAERKIMRKAAIYAVFTDRPKLIELFIEHGVEPFPKQLSHINDDLLINALHYQKQQGKPQKSVRVLLNQINTIQQLQIASKILRTARQLGYGDAEAELMIDDLSTLVVGGLKSQSIVDNAAAKYPDMMLVSFYQLNYHMNKEQYPEANKTLIKLDQQFKNNPFYQRNAEQFRLLLGQFEEAIRYAPITKRSRKNLDEHQIAMDTITVMSQPHPLKEMMRSNKITDLSDDMFKRLEVYTYNSAADGDIDTYYPRLFSEIESHKIPKKIRVRANTLLRGIHSTNDDDKKVELIGETIELLLSLNDNLVYLIHPQLAYLYTYNGILIDSLNNLELSLMLALPQNSVPMLDDELMPGINKLCKEEPAFMSEVFFQEILLSMIDTLDELDYPSEERRNEFDWLIKRTLGVLNKEYFTSGFYGRFREQDMRSTKILERLNRIIDFADKHDISTPSVSQIVMEEVEHLGSLIQHASDDYKQDILNLKAKAMRSKLYSQKYNVLITIVFATLIPISLITKFFVSKKTKNKPKPNDNHERPKINRTKEKPHQSAKSAPQYDFIGELERVEFHHLKDEHHRCFITLPSELNETLMQDAKVSVEDYEPQAERLTTHAISRAIKLAKYQIKEKISVEQAESDGQLSLIVSIKNNSETFHDVFKNFMTRFEKALINNLPGVLEQSALNKLIGKVERMAEKVETITKQIKCDIEQFTQEVCDQLKTEITTLESQKTTPFVLKNVSKIHKTLATLEKRREHFTKIEFDKPENIKQQNQAELQQSLQSLEKEAKPIQFAHSELSQLVKELKTGIENLQEQDVRKIIEFKFDLPSADKTSSDEGAPETKAPSDIDDDDDTNSNNTLPEPYDHDDNSAADDNDVASEETSTKEIEPPIMDNDEDNISPAQQIAEPKELTQEELYRITCDPSLFKVINPSKQVSTRQKSSSSASSSSKSSQVNNKEQALIKHVEIIIDAIKAQSNQLLDDIELTRRKSIYALIDLFARLNLGLMAMEKNQLIAKYSLSRDVGNIRDVLRHNAMCYIYAGDDLSQHRMLYEFCKDLTRQLTRAINNKPLAKKPNAAIFAKIQLKETLTAPDVLTGLNEDINFLTRVQSKLSHEGSQARRQHNTFFLGMISQIGNQCQKLKSIDPTLYTTLCMGDKSSRYVKIEELFTEKVSADQLTTQQVLSLCLQVRNIRGHEQDDDSQLPQYHANQMRYRDHFDGETLSRLINVISERAKDIVAHVNRVHRTLVDGQVATEVVGSIVGHGNK